MATAEHDPLKYFRIEAKDLLDNLNQAALELEKLGYSAEKCEQLLRDAHTLKGAARVVKQVKIAEFSHDLESLIGPLRTHKEAYTPEFSKTLISVLDKISAQVALLNPSLPRENIKLVGSSTPNIPHFETVRLDLEEVDSLVQKVSELGIQISQLRDILKQLPDPRKAMIQPQDDLQAQLERSIRQSFTSMDRIERELEQLQDRAQKLRLLPSRTIFPALERVVRDEGLQAGKQVHFETRGGDHRLDGHILALIREGLLHVVRNAVIHGIESPIHRTSQNKSEMGNVLISVERREQRIAFVCQDDGRGLDLEKLKEKAIELGIISQTQSSELTESDTRRLILLPGLSTSEKLTEVSGRGIGLDVLNHSVQKLGGTIAIQSSQNAGTRIEIEVPVNISSICGLIIEANQQTVSIPMNSIRSSLRIKANDLSRSGSQDCILFEDKVIPFSPLSRILETEDDSSLTNRKWTTVIVESNQMRVGLGVDRMLGAKEIVVQPIPRLMGPIPLYTGASIDRNGKVQPVLSPHGLVEAVMRLSKSSSYLSTDHRQLPILIVDDSLTTRMLEQRVLESAGYSVEVAQSAEEAIEKTQKMDFSLFLVDVEMPGMSGLDFVSYTRKNLRLSEVPAIIVSSRGSEEDKKLGIEAGAQGYIVKGSFDEGKLLSMIQNLIGPL